MNAFSQALSTRIPPVALVMAPDAEDRKKALSLFRSDSTLFINSADFSKEKFFQEIEQFDLFIKKKNLILEEFQLLKKEEVEVVSNYLERINHHITLILLASENIHAPKFLQKIEQEGIVLSLLEEKPWDKKARLIHETLQYLKQRGVVMESQICAQFVEAQGLDQSLIRQEIDKVLAYIGDAQQITQKDMEAVSIFASYKNIWDFVDTLFQRKCAEAITIGSQLLEEGSLFHLIATLRSQMKTSLEILNLYKEQGKEATTKHYPHLKGNLLEKKLVLLEGYGVHSLFLSSSVFFDIELQLRDGNRDEIFLLELLCVRLTTC